MSGGNSDSRELCFRGFDDCTAKRALQMCGPFISAGSADLTLDRLPQCFLLWSSKRRFIIILIKSVLF